MKLSQAILLGDTLKKCDPGSWISQDGRCGCALGGALLATGVTVEQFREEWIAHKFTEIPCIMSRWPWMKEEIIDEISRMYYRVAEGNATIEDIAAYVESVEPEESDEDLWGEPSSDTANGMELDWAHGYGRGQ